MTAKVKPQGKSQRGTIFVERAVVIDQQAYPGDQYVIRMTAPRCAANATAGSFAHVRCDPAVPMRRPLSIMRASPEEGWIELLYKVLGDGLQHLATRRAGDTVNVIGPIGKPFSIDPQRDLPLLIGGGVGIPPMVFLAETMTHEGKVKPLVLMGSELPFPFETAPSQLSVAGIPEDVTHAMPLVESWGAATRLASWAGYEGCYKGFVTELGRLWLDSLSEADRQRIQVFACGPTPMLEASARLAQDFDLPCQLSLEEFMACAVGGCAGCTVAIHNADGVSMKRVCVDGPVFDAREVYPPG